MTIMIMTETTDMASPRKVIGIAFATQYVELGIQFLAVLVLARLLSPDQIGTFSVAAFLMSMLHAFRDFGVAQYIIQERDLTRDKLQSAMGVAILLALAVALVLYAISAPVARFYGHPALESVLHVMSLSFAVSPFGSVMMGLLRREQRLRAIFCVKTASAVCHVSVAIVLALNGYGAISLAWANFAGILTFGVAGNLLRPPGTPWLPRLRNVRKILSFGSVSSLGNLANTAGASAPEMVIGKVLNMASVGYFSRATGLVQLFTRLITGALNPLVLPYFAQMRRQGQDLTRPYLLAVEHLTALAWPFFGALLVLAYPMVRSLYGANWDASVPLVRLLCVAGALGAVTLFASQAMIANGQLRSSTLCGLVVEPVRVVAVLASAQHGIAAVAAAMVVAELFSLLVASWFLKRALGVHPTHVLRACARSALITAAVVAGPLLLWRLWDHDPHSSWPPLLAGIASAAVGWLAALRLTGHPLGEHVLPLLGLAPRGAAGAPGLKQQLKQWAYRGGLLAAYHRLRNRRTLTVSMFHRVLPPSDPRYPGADPEWTMTPESLEHCLRFFKRHYRLVSAEQVFAALRGEAVLPPRSMLVTFDDGWADTAEFAQPVLDRLQVPALVFVAGEAIDRATPFWEERVYSFIATDPNALVHLAQELAHAGLAPLELGPDAVAGEAGARRVIAQLGQRERAAVLALAARLPDPAGALPAMLDRAQLARLVAAGHAIGGHGMTHQPLTRVAALAPELTAAQARVAGLLQRGAVESMSLPHGASSAAVLDACRAAGYRYLFDSAAHLNVLERSGGAGAVGRIHISERAIVSAGRFDPARLAASLFLRPLKPLPAPGAAHG
jgi:O-antigen/teichoic acid export membrane protein/peptidoglycan/xylan/chitin deacetylase (PgdA/CDA1 family)